MSDKRNDKKSDQEIYTAKILDKVRPTPILENGLNDEQKMQIISKNFAEIMTTLGLDLNNDSLQNTPNRVAKMFVQEWFYGLKPEKFPKISVFDNEMAYDQMIVEKNINVKSVCEHHFVIIDGYAHVAYIPEKKVIGLSKMNRIVDYFARRPQVQERLTKQIADCLEYVLETPHVAVYIDAKHYCVVSRGVQDINSRTSTSDLRGDFKNSAETRAEFMSLCKA